MPRPCAITRPSVSGRRMRRPYERRPPSGAASLSYEREGQERQRLATLEQPDRRGQRADGARIAAAAERAEQAGTAAQLLRQRLIERSPSGEDDQIDVLVLGDLGALFRDRDRRVESAERVHEPALARLLTGPDASLRHRVD